MASNILSFLAANPFTALQFPAGWDGLYGITTGGTTGGGTGGGTPGTTTTAAVTVAAAGNHTDGGASVNTTYTVAAGTYAYTIAGFNDGDVLQMFAGYAATVASDVNQADGIQDIAFADAASGTTVTITLTGLSAADDAVLFSAASINTVFGPGTLV